MVNHITQLYTSEFTLESASYIDFNDKWLYIRPNWWENYIPTGMANVHLVG
jgi:hypothetical protein